MASPPSQPQPQQRPEHQTDRASRAADLPSHPDSHDEIGVQSGPRSRTQAGWRTYLFVVGGVALVTMFVVLHLTGTLGPGGH
jgi:hypothetical protein